MNKRGCSTLLKVAIILFLVEKYHGKILRKRANDCSIRVHGGLGEPQPLILCPIRGKQEFVYPLPSGKGSLIAHPGESFRIACPGSKLNISTSGTYDETIATCVGGDDFLLEGPRVTRKFNTIACEKYPTYVAQKIAKTTDVPCSNGDPYEIGFPFSGQGKKSEFYRMIDLCHDEKMANTLYAHAKIRSVIDSAQRAFPRTPFRKGSFFRGIPIQAIYSKGVQRATLGRLLNSTDLAMKYIPQTGSYFFSRGHLIAKTDFVYGSQQRATFFYANVVPMWQNINGGNWATMENNLKTLASEKGLDFDVWVGGYGILQLDDINNNKRDIYLHVDAKGREAVPVPKILFKVVYNYKTRSGIVFLTANNPFLKTLTAEYRLCKDVCGKVNYLTWNAKIPEQGLSYCCEIDDFRKAYPSIPCFTTSHLLL